MSAVKQLQGPIHLSATMTVNHALYACPCTRRVFERLLINPAIEGVDCLDEVAWRHGLSIEELIRMLEATSADHSSCAA